MMKRKQYSSQFKAQVAFEGAKNHQTIAQIASEYSVHPHQVTHWKKQLLNALPEIFTNQRNASSQANAQLVDELYRQIGQLKVELDWLKKKVALNR